MAESTVGIVKCDGCLKSIKFPLTKLGLSGKCPQCGHPIKLLDQTPKAIATRPGPPEIPIVRDQTVVSAELVNTAPGTIQVPMTAADHAATLPVESPARRFMGEGQNPEVVYRLLARIGEICTSSEEPLYMAVQQKPIANISPDAIVLTNRRAIVFRQKMLGRLEFVDCQWLQVADIHMKENLIGATISIRGISGHVETVDYVPKDQARRVYRIGQEMEEQMTELRRTRRMEEDRNAAGGVVVNATVNTPATGGGATAQDPVERLRKLKSMLDAELISSSEYETTKAKILADL